jgi:hypothetical protein
MQKSAKYGLQIETLGRFRVIRSGSPVKEAEWHGGQARKALPAIPCWKMPTASHGPLCRHWQAQRGAEDLPGMREGPSGGAGRRAGGVNCLPVQENRNPALSVSGAATGQEARVTFWLVVFKCGWGPCTRNSIIGHRFGGEGLQVKTV